MATIRRKALAAYRQTLDRVCSGSGSAARRALATWLDANPGASVAEIREAAIELTDAVLGAYGDAASSLACDLFDSVMEAEGVDVPVAQIYGGVREGAVEGTVRRIVGDVDGSQASLDAFTELVGQLAERETRLAASATVEENVERAAKTKAGRNVRYARVPTSAVPCAWCAMLASRGFVYRNAESAEAASHHHCTCTIVPGIKGVTQVADYDPKHYADVWQHRERYEEKPGMVAEFDLKSDGLIRQEGGASLSDLPEGSIDAMVSFADEFDASYPALRDAEGTYPMGLSNLTVCTTRDIMEEGGISAGDAEGVLGMFMKAKDGSFNAGIYMNAELLSSATLEEVVSDFRHEYGHYVGWFIERSGAGSVNQIVEAALGEFLPRGLSSSGLLEAAISSDLSDYAGNCWGEGKLGEVFAEAFRVWQEGGESRIAAILGPMIDEALRGIA